MSEIAREPLGFGVMRRLGLLAASLRAGGVRVGVGELLAAHRALAAVDPASRRDAYNALRTVLCSHHSDYEVFDVAFTECFGAPHPGDGLHREPPPELGPLANVVLPRAPAPPPPDAPRPDDSADLDPDPVSAAWSAVELLHDKDFAEYTDAERELARRLIARLAMRGPRRPSRRTKPARRRGPRPAGGRQDLRRTMRASLRYGGEPVERRWRERTDRPRPLVLVCDVSGSMESYARMLVQYLQSAVAASRRVEAFAFGTRLTRITHELRGRDPDAAVARASEAVADWSGGTRIGDALAHLNREYARYVGRGSAVVVLSDGWDRGDPILLEMEMERLARCAHSVVWLNPLKASPDYEPLTRGMRAALPHVDHFLAGNSIASLEELAELLEGGLE
ncbi:MAG: uncharacterized protein QOJ12_2541 [Thermoleophilales bacterium]|nr:uncharacterized protein [Thermoleophilales bacterium]